MRGSVARPEVSVGHAEDDCPRFDRDDTTVWQGIPWVSDDIDSRSRSAKPRNGGEEQTLSPIAILVILATIGLVCVGGYFLLMKLIDVSRQEDCLLAGRRNCAAIEVPSSR
jgi:hypothetical protein